MEELKLFVMESCPFCKKVMSYLKRNNLSVEILDINKDLKNKEELERIGGKVQVPMLLIGDKPLYESSDIIDWFKANR